jgi:hypothetical protein
MQRTLYGPYSCSSSDSTAVNTHLAWNLPYKLLWTLLAVVIYNLCFQSGLPKAWK